MLKSGLVSTIALMAFFAVPAYATTIDFSTLPLYTAVSTQYSGVSFSLIGGPGTGVPVTGSFGTYGLGNSPTGDYPTSEVLNVAFSSGVSGLSFTFNNFGDNNFAPSFYTATGAGGVISQGNIDFDCCAYSVVNVAGTGITNLAIDNGSGGAYSWEFGVGQVTYSAAPEASTWAMLLIGFAGLGFAGYRQSRSAKAI